MSAEQHCQRSVTNETAPSLDESAIESFIVSVIILSLLTISYRTVIRLVIKSEAGTHP